MPAQERTAIEDAEIVCMRDYEWPGRKLFLLSQDRAGGSEELRLIDGDNSISPRRVSDVFFDHIGVMMQIDHNALDVCRKQEIQPVLQ